MSSLPKGCIGMKGDLTEKQLKGAHIARGGYVFKTEKDYLNHTSPETGFKPTDIRHQDALTGGRASRIAEKAQERGADKAAGAKKKKR